MDRSTPDSTTRTWVTQGALGGLIAGIVMAMVAMLYTLVAQGDLLAPLEQMGATFFPASSGSALSMLAGAMLHMMMSVLLGIVFAFLVRGRAAGRLQLVVAGMAFILVEWAVARFIVLPIVDAPLVATFGASGGIIAHLMFGVVIATWLAHSVALPDGTRATLTRRPA